MAKVFRSWGVDQGWLLPPSLHGFMPPGHMAHFVRNTAREALDLSAVLDTYTEERGCPPYHPGMMVALLLYGYSRGLYSSCQLARACEERVDVMAVTGLASAPLPPSARATSWRCRTCSCRCCVYVEPPVWSSSPTWRWMAPSSRRTPHATKR